MEQQSFFYSNTHYSDTHYLHNNNPVSTEWSLGVPSSRPSGFEQYKSLGHTDFYGQTTLDMYRPGGIMDKPDYLMGGGGSYMQPPINYGNW